MNQELEQYLQFFVDHRQKDWPKWLASAEFAINNKVHSATKISLFIANYRREMRMGTDIRKKGKVEKATVKIEDYGLSFSLFSFLILFSLIYFFIFSIFRTLGLGRSDWSHCHI